MYLKRREVLFYCYRLQHKKYYLRHHTFILVMLYPIIRKILFNFSPEKAHQITSTLLQTASRVGPLHSILNHRFNYSDKDFSQELFGLQFKNPIGLAAGFDKNAHYMREMEMLGFGFMEVGTVTPKAQPGNPQPRLFRLPTDKALINRMGFNNDGVEQMVRRLGSFQEQKSSSKSSLIIGGNIGKNKVTENENAWQDYVTCFNALFDYVDYFVVNVSSPNTPNLRELQEKDSLLKIMGTLQEINQGKAKPKPLLLKIAPDLNHSQLNDIVDLAVETKLDGIVATNTTITRENLKTPATQVEKIGAGGLSGLPVRNISNLVLSEIAPALHTHDIKVIASGGIFTGEDAVDKLNRGADLLQVYTGFIYEGPMMIKRLCEAIAAAK